MGSSKKVVRKMHDLRLLRASDPMPKHEIRNSSGQSSACEDDFCTKDRRLMLDLRESYN